MNGCKKGSEDHYWCWIAWHSDSVIMIIITVMIVMMISMMNILMMIMKLVKSCHLVHQTRNVMEIIWMNLSPNWTILIEAALSMIAIKATKQ